MAKIPLRAYVHEIENLIERGEIDPAVAHAKNILKTYPKHIETYRLLGKAFLESQRYTQALDILQRVLAVIPDDFISQIGMSIIREDEGNLDQAIWHMERAYEVQPFNPAVQDELRRLYGRRDGVQPPKIRLTRGALVRMYARGELYPQAIAETLAALAEDPNRTDLEVLLARLYYLSKQKIEAIEACSRLLKHLPYCKEALEILTRVLPETNRASDAPYYLQRLYTLDPYAAFLSPNAPTSDQVPEQAVMVERFNLDMSMAEVQTPEWTQNIGVQWEEPEAEDLPDWLNTLKPAQESGSGSLAFTAPESSAPVGDTGLPPADELMPDFLKDAGWTQSDRRADDIMKESLMQESGEEQAAAPAEIPDWLQSIAPAQAGTPEEDERTDWLDSILPTAAGANGRTEPAPQTETPSMVDGFDPALDADLAADLPDWLSGMDQETETPAAAETLSADAHDWLSGIASAQEPGEGAAAPAEAEQSLDWLAGIEQPEQAAGTEAAPDWISSLGEPAGETASPTGEDVPDWLKGLGEHPNDTQMLQLGDDAFGAPESAAPVSEQPAAEEAAEVPGMPDWLQAMEAGAEPSALGETAADVADSTGWMAAFGEDETATEEEAAAADIPEWMQGLAPTEEEQAEAKSALFDSPTAETPEPAAAEAAPADSMPDINDVDATMAWLEALAAKQGADEATLLISDPEKRSETPPEWIQQQQASGEAAVEPEPAQAADIPDWLAELSPTAQDEPVMDDTIAAAEGVEEFIPGREQDMLETALPAAETPAEVEPSAAPEAELAQPDFSDTDATMAWLEALAARQGADEATLITSPDQRTETPPEWIQQAADQPDAEAQPAADQPEAEAAVAADLPDWLQEIEQPSAEAVSGEVEAQAIDADAGFAKIFDEPQLDAQPADVEPLAEQPEAAEIGTPWPVDSYAGDEIARSAAEPVVMDAGAGEAQPEAAAPDAMPDMSDMDAAMAWLESLAAKQGADEATLLISNPNERTDTPPEWIQKQAAEAEAVQEAQPVEAEAAAADVPDWLSELEQPAAEPVDETGPVWPVDSYAGEEMAREAASQEIPDLEITAQEISTPAPEMQAESAAEPTAEAEAMPDMTDMDAAMAWLEALAAKQGADEATLLISDPEKRSETPPEWVRKQTGELRMPEALATEADQPAAVEPAQAEELPDWLKEADQEASIPAAEKTQPLARPSTGTPVDSTVSDETAAWLESLHASEEEAEAAGMAEETAEPAQESGTVADGELMPQWLTSLEAEEYSSAEEDLAAEPAVEPAVVPVDISSAWVPEEEAPELAEQQVPQAAQGALSLPDLQAALRRGDLDRALDGYSRLIQSGEMIDETIHDLRDALYRYPVDIMIWQTLGDAYSRNNQLQEALDAYTKAEELLR